jgi:hypothetical protein
MDTGAESTPTTMADLPLAPPGKPMKDAINTATKIEVSIFFIFSPPFNLFNGFLQALKEFITSFPQHGAMRS